MNGLNKELSFIASCLHLSTHKHIIKVLNYLQSNKSTINNEYLSRIHGDYHPWNVMLSDEVVYIIDWKEAFGDYRYEVAWTYSLLKRSGEHAFADAFLSHYKSYCPNVMKNFNYFIVLASIRWYVSVLLSPPKVDQEMFFNRLIDAMYDNIKEITGINFTDVKY